MKQYLWEANSAVISDESARALVYWVVSSTLRDIVKGYRDFKNGELDRSNLITALKLWIETPLFTYWADWFHDAVNQDENMNYAARRLGVLVRYLLYKVRAGKKPNRRGIVQARMLMRRPILISGHYLGGLNRCGKQKPPK